MIIVSAFGRTRQILKTLFTLFYVYVFYILILNLH